MTDDTTGSTADSGRKYAVSLQHLLWEDAASEAEAIAHARTRLAEMDEADLDDLEFSVVDSVPRDEW